MTFLVPSSQGAQIFPFRKYPLAHTLQYGPACNVHRPWHRLRKWVEERGARGTCECTATPVIASRSNVGGAVCDPTTSAPSQRRRTARTHRLRVLCTGDGKTFPWKCEHTPKEKAYEPRLHSSTLLAATYGNLRDTLRPAQDRQRSPRMRRGGSQGSLRKCLNRSANPSGNTSAPHLWARCAGLSAPVPADLGALHNRARRRCT